jgi:lipid II:glycine glycyltransferase (peptidoglycan interpeptide bridge formation enzyme)
VSLVDEFIKKAIEELPENTFLIRMDPEVEYSDEINKLYQDAGFVTRNTQFEHMHSNIQPRKNMIFSFEGMTSQDEVFMSYQPDTRNYIRKSGEVSTIVGNSSELMKTFYELHKMMAEYHGISYRPENYFLTIQENFPNVEELQIFLTSTTEGTPVEASVATNFGNKSWLMYAGMNRRYAKTNATYQNRDFWLKFEFQKGLEYADFGGIQSETKEDGLYVAKKKFLRNQPVTVYIGEIDKVLDQTKYQEYLKRFDA